MVHILLMPMASNGTGLEVTTIPLKAQRWKLKPNFNSLDAESRNITPREQLFTNIHNNENFVLVAKASLRYFFDGCLVFRTVSNCYIYFVHYL